MMTLDGSARSLRRLGRSALAAGCVLVAPILARAAEPPSEVCADAATARDPEAAKVAFRAGQTAFSEGAYARAVEFWNQAYRDDCTAHALLLNLAMAEELLGRPDDAIHTLTLFNRRSPESPYVEANVKRIQRLEQMAAEMSRDQAFRRRLATAPVEDPEASSDSGFALSLPLAIGVAGGVVALAGAGLYAEGRVSASSATDRCGGSPEACTDVGAVVDGERARARAQAGGWLALGGLATAAGGIVWYVLSQPSRPLDQTRHGLSLTFDPGGAAVGWSGRF